MGIDDKDTSLLGYILGLEPEHRKDAINQVLNSLDRAQAEEFLIETETTELSDTLNEIHEEQRQAEKEETKLAFFRSKRESRKKDIIEPATIEFLPLYSAFTHNQIGEIIPVEENEQGWQLYHLMCNFVRAINSEDDEHEIRSYIDHNVDIGSEDCIVCYEWGKIVSYCLFFIGQRTSYVGYNAGPNRSIHINQIFTKGSKQGRGYGAQMINLLEKLLIIKNSQLKTGEEPVECIELKVDKNLSAVDFYEKVDFQKARDKHGDIIELLVEGVPHYLMVKSFKATLHHYINPK